MDSSDDKSLWDASPRKLHLMARSEIQERNFAKALGHLSEAASRCGCVGRLDWRRDADSPQHHVLEPACKDHLAKLLELIQQKTPARVYKWAKGPKPCECGHLYGRCSNEVHMAVLDDMAQMYENLQEKLQALVVGSFMVCLNPASPFGYCRMVKTMRFMEKSWGTGNHFVEARDAFFAGLAVEDQSQLGSLLHSVARTGHSLVQVYGNPSGPKFNLLATIVSKMQGQPVRGVDPIMTLPFELRTYIFDNLDTGSLMKCQAVNQTWQAVLKDPVFWRRVTLNRPMVSLTNFMSFLRRHNGIKELGIRDVSHVGFDAHMFRQLFKALPSLESLSLGSPFDIRKLRATQKPIMSSLKKLSFVNPGEGNLGLVREVLQSARETLEELSIIGPLNRGEELVQLNGAPWKLTSLRLDLTKPAAGRGARQRPDNPRSVSLMSLVLATPNLEQLYLDGFGLEPHVWSAAHTPGPPPDEFQRGWRGLRVLVLGEHMRGAVDSAMRFYLPSLNDEIRVLDLITQCTELTHHALFDMDPVPRGQIPPIHWHNGSVHLPKLQVFRSKVRIHHHGWLNSIVGPSIEAGNLRSLDVCLSLGLQAVYYLDEADRLRPELAGRALVPMPVDDLPFTFSDKITTLGVSQFSWNDSGDYYSTLDPRPFLQYLDHFPAVRTVRVYPGYQANTLGLIQGIMRHKNKVREIFQDSLELRDWYIAKEEAETRAVRLHHQYKRHAPPLFPYVATWPKPVAEPDADQNADADADADADDDDGDGIW